MFNHHVACLGLAAAGLLAAYAGVPRPGLWYGATALATGVLLLAGLVRGRVLSGCSTWLVATFVLKSLVTAGKGFDAAGEPTQAWHRYLVLLVAVLGTWSAWDEGEGEDAAGDRRAELPG